MKSHVKLQSKQGVGHPQHNTFLFTSAVRAALCSPLWSLALGVVVAVASAGPALAGNATSRVQDESTAVAREKMEAIFQLALADDVAGRHGQARKWFDALQSTELQEASAVPSAVNLAVLGRFEDAKSAFDKLASNPDSRVSSYAKLWQLWLFARTHAGKPSALQKQLIAPAKAIKAKDAPAKALAALFAGKGSASEVFAAIEAESFPSEALRQDARAEAAFFVGGYLQYVRQDKTAALKIYRHELPSSNASIERPLIKQAIEAL